MSTFTDLYPILKNTTVTITCRYYIGGLPKYRSGSGFLIRVKGELMVATAMHVVFYTNNRDPMDVINCGVFNINGKPSDNRVFRMQIAICDGFADVTILRFDPSNKGSLPSPYCHPYCKIVNNYNEKTGEMVCNISNPLDKDVASIVRGTLRDEKYFSGSSSIKASCITTSCPVYPTSSGSAISNECGQCIGMVTFGFISSPGISQAAFSGGVGGYTLRIIINHLKTGYSTETITARGQTYLSNLKGWFGEVSYDRVSTKYLSTNYQNRLSEFKIKGIYLTEVAKDSTLSHPLDGAEPLQKNDIITEISFPDGVRPPIDVNTETVQIGVSDLQLPLGAALWNYNPRDENNIATLKVIYKPSVNSKQTKIRVRLYQIPEVEYPPNGNSNLAGDDTAPQPLGSFFSFRGFTVTLLPKIETNDKFVKYSMNDFLGNNVIPGESPSILRYVCKYESDVYTDPTGPTDCTGPVGPTDPTGPTNPVSTYFRTIPICEGRSFLPAPTNPKYLVVAPCNYTIYSAIDPSSPTAVYTGESNLLTADTFMELSATDTEITYRGYIPIYRSTLPIGDFPYLTLSDDREIGQISMTIFNGTTAVTVIYINALPKTISYYSFTGKIKFYQQSDKYSIKLAVTGGNSMSSIYTCYGYESGESSDVLNLDQDMHNPNIYGFKNKYTSWGCPEQLPKYPPID